jgi:ABC-type uncharacterized transport system permease subunit
MPPLVERITEFCFAASYAVALLLELWHLLRPRPIQRVLSLVFGGAGLLAHTMYVFVQPLRLDSALGSLIFLAWILAFFYFYGSLHHGKVAWGIFVLPLVLGLVALGVAMPRSVSASSEGSLMTFVSGEGFWGGVHGSLLLLAAVGVCVGFVASVMYLVQVRRLRTKMAPNHGMRMLSLERLEEMNRRAILLSFPLLTAGLVVGIALQLHTGQFFEAWSSPKILSVVGLWVVFAVLLYLRYAVHVRGRQVALWTIFAFALLLLALVSAHPFVQGAGL